MVCFRVRLSRRWRALTVSRRYTITRALPRVDPPTACLLRTAAFALHGAVEAGVVPVEWGASFGAELSATPKPRVVGPCLDEANHEDACSCASDPFSC